MGGEEAGAEAGEGGFFPPRTVEDIFLEGAGIGAGIEDEEEATLHIRRAEFPKTFVCFFSFLSFFLSFSFSYSLSLSFVVRIERVEYIVGQSFFLFSFAFFFFFFFSSFFFFLFSTI